MSARECDAQPETRARKKPKGRIAQARAPNTTWASSEWVRVRWPKRYSSAPETKGKARPMRD
jgi:hypothetical protein